MSASHLTPQRRPHQARRDRQRSCSGLTLIEALIVLLLIGVLLAVAVPAWSEHLARRRVEAAAALLQADLAELRSAAVARDTGLRLTFRNSPQASCYLLHDGDAALCTCPIDEQGEPAPACADGARLLKARTWPARDLIVQANITSLRTDPRIGNVSPSGSVELRAPGLQPMRLVINLLGRVRLCSVASDEGMPASPALPGWRGLSPC